MPSPAVLAAEGIKAVQAGRYAEAIAKLSEALRERAAPLWLLERSKAHLRAGDAGRALHDAERALRAACDRASRDLMAEAQIRRAVACFRLRRFADADVCAFWAVRLCEGARASEDDGQLRRLRGGAGGDYDVTLAEVTEADARRREEERGGGGGGGGSGAQRDGLAAAMAGGARSKETQWKNQAFSWRLQALAQLEKLPKGDPGRKVTITEKYPNPPEEFVPAAETTVEEKTASAMDVEDDEDEDEDENGAAEKKSAGKVASAPGERDEASRKAAWEDLWNQYRAVHAKNDIRYDYYETDTTLNISFFVKNVPKDGFKVEVQADSVVLGPIPHTHTKQIHLFPYGKVKPEGTTHEVKSMKIELVLKKDTPGKWPALRKEKSELVDNLTLKLSSAPSFNQFYTFVTSLGYQNPEDLQLKGPVSEQQTDLYDDLLERLRTGLKSTGSTTTEKAAPSVPTAAVSHTSTPTQPKTSQVGSSSTTATTSTPLADLTNKSTQPTTPAATTSGPAYPTSSKKGPKNWDNIDDDEDGDDKDGGGDVNSFFQSLYQSADPDTRRAMMKSYIESNGTSLSTSWSEAKDKKYETLPPDGSEAKNW